MKKVKNFFIPLLVFFLLCGQSIAVQATAFDLISSEKETVERVLDFHNFQFLKEEPQKTPITQFAVNSEGYIALGYDAGSNQQIVVYKEKQFQYGYSFHGEGVFALEIVSDDTIVTFVRGDVSVELSSDGQISVLGDVADTDENHDYMSELRNTIKKTIGDKTYRIQTDPEILYFLFSPNYTHLIITEADGSKTVLYDASQAQWAGMGKTVIAFVAFGCVSVGFTLYQKHMKKKHNT